MTSPSPPDNAKEAVQWLYFGYLAAIKDPERRCHERWAASPPSWTSTSSAIWTSGILTESEAQELIDHLIMKLRMVKFARIPGYNQLFSGDPIWVTLEVVAAWAWTAAPW